MTTRDEDVDLFTRFEKSVTICDDTSAVDWLPYDIRSLLDSHTLPKLQKPLDIQP